MLASSQLMAFAATKQPEKARAFYVEVLGLVLVAREPTALVFDANGSMLRGSIVKEFSPQPFTVLGWRVAEMRSMRRDLAAKGVIFENYGFPGQDTENIWTTPDGAQVAWFKDPDGNLLSITQFP